MVKKNKSPSKMTDNQVKKLLSVGGRLHPKDEKFPDSLDSNFNKLSQQVKKSKRDMKLVKKYGSDAMKSRAFGSSDAAKSRAYASGGNVASYYGKGGRVAGCGPAQNKG